MSRPIAVVFERTLMGHRLTVRLQPMPDGTGRAQDFWMEPEDVEAMDPDTAWHVFTLIMTRVCDVWEP